MVDDIVMIVNCHMTLHSRRSSSGLQLAFHDAVLFRKEVVHEYLNNLTAF